MKIFFILLIVVLMLAGLTSTTFAGQGVGKGVCDQIRDPEVCEQVGSVCPNPEDCPIGDENQYRGGK